MRGPRLLFFGDSHVAGVGDSSGLGWVGRVVAASLAAGGPVTAYNLGVRGETSVQVASRFRAEAQPRLAPGVDTRIVVSFGANDTTCENGDLRVEPGRSVHALETILNHAGALGCPALMVSPAPVDDPSQNQRLAELSASFAAVCAQRDVPYITVLDDLLASPLWMAQVAAGDGAHPGAGGYTALADLILAGGILDWLSAPALSSVSAPGRCVSGSAS